MLEPDAYFANLQRGAQLLSMERPREAIPFFGSAIAANPDHPHAYADLARAWNALGDRTKALRAIHRAISLAPQASAYLGLKSWFLICQKRFRPALATAQEGLALNPNCYQSLNSLANAYTKLGRWKQAETACLRILALNPNDAPALNLLAQALRHQGRWKESRETVARLLASLPNNAFGHANAGYGALAAGDHLRANEHFRESLRLDPRFDFARRGLLESIRARIWIIRLNTMVLSKLPRQVRGLIAFAFSASLLFFLWPDLNDPGPSHLTDTWPGLLIWGAVGYFYLSILTMLLTNFLLIFDPVGRHALKPKEKDYALVPAFLYVLVIVAFSVAQQWLIVAGLVLFFLLLALSIHYPLLKDRWQRRREREAA